MPSYLAKTNYREPDDANVNNYSDMDPDKLNFFGRLAKSPEVHAAFTGHMEAYTSWKTPWTETYDTKRLVEGAKLDDGSALVVDLGGNTGIDISRVLAKHPDLPAGSLVLQDPPEMVAKAQVDPKITAMAHDFFKPQPVKGEPPTLSYPCGQNFRRALQQLIVLRLTNYRSPCLLHARRLARLARLDRQDPLGEHQGCHGEGIL